MIFALIMLALVAASIALYWKFADGDFILDELWIMESLQKVFMTGKPKSFRDMVVGHRVSWQEKPPIRGLLNWTYQLDIANHTTRTRERIDIHRRLMRLRSFVYHGLFAGLTFAFLRAFVSTVPATIGALAVLLHPQSVPAVIPISGRSSVMCGLFYLAALLAALSGGGCWTAVPVFLIAGYKCKEEIAFAPLGIAAVLAVMR